MVHALIQKPTTRSRIILFGGRTVQFCWTRKNVDTLEVVHLSECMRAGSNGRHTFLVHVPFLVFLSFSVLQFPRSSLTELPISVFIPSFCCLYPLPLFFFGFCSRCRKVMQCTFLVEPDDNNKQPKVRDVVKDHRQIQTCS